MLVVSTEQDTTSDISESGEISGESLGVSRCEEFAASERYLNG